MIVITSLGVRTMFESKVDSIVKRNIRMMLNFELKIKKTQNIH
jgi:hypothetical protein